MKLLQAQKFAEARKIFEDLLAKYPDVHQLNAYIAQSYAGENNMPKAVEYMRIASDKDPTNAEMRLVLADLIMEQGDKAAALEMMKEIDITKVKNPLPFINASITLINESKTDEALEMLNKVVDAVPDARRRPTTTAAAPTSPRRSTRGARRIWRSSCRWRRRTRASCRREEDPRADQRREVDGSTTGHGRLHAPLIALLLGGCSSAGVWRLRQRRYRSPSPDASGAGQPESLHQRG